MPTAASVEERVVVDVPALALADRRVIDQFEPARGHHHQRTLKASRGGVRVGLIGLLVGATGAAVVKGSVPNVTFNNGAAAVTLPPGADIVSDQISLAADPGHEVGVSLALSSSPPLTWHSDGHTIAYATATGIGDRTTDTD